jgi:hypothetical protein
MDNNAADIHEDSGRYLQEYIQSKLLQVYLKPSLLILMVCFRP